MHAQNSLRMELRALVKQDGPFFDFVQKGALDGIWYWDPEKPDVGWANTRFWSLLGYHAKEKRRLGSQWQTLVDPDDWRAMCRQAHHCGDDPDHPFEMVLSCRHKDGSTVWVRGRAFVIRPDKTKSRRILCILTDLTLQKLAEERLKSNRTLTEAVFDSIQDGISVLDREFTIITVNPAMKKWYADTLPLEGKKCYQVYHGQPRACERCPTRRALKSGKLEMDEVPMIKQGKAVGTLELYAFPMLDEAGRIETVVEYVRDITARKQAESLLKERERLFRSIFEDNCSAMLLLDPSTGTIVDANPSACAFYGYPRPVLTDMQIMQINTLSREAVLKEMQKAESEERTYFDFRHRLADGTIRDVEVFSGPVTIGGRSLLCSVIHDVTARKQAEREKEQLIVKLQKALSEVKTLRGFLPICASCKKIRDDKGYWNRIETYIRNHSEAQFSHGLCPECARKLYPGLTIETEP